MAKKRRGYKWVNTGRGRRCQSPKGRFVKSYLCGKKKKTTKKRRRR